MTYDDLPKDKISEIILVDDASKDDTVRLAKELGLKVYLHRSNYGYGANQKTCYIEALREGADIIVMVHPDYQYDPTLVPEMIKPIENGGADIVLGSRLLKDNVLKQGMPWWKYISNRALTIVENKILNLNLSEYHTGYRAYSREALEQINFLLNSDKFVFDQDFLIQAAHLKLRIKEIPVPTRYFPEASSASFVDSCIYGISILISLFKYILHKKSIIIQSQFEPSNYFKERYKKAE